MIGCRLGDPATTDPGELANWLLTGRVDVKDDDLIRGNECLAEAARQSLGT